MQKTPQMPGDRFNRYHLSCFIRIEKLVGFFVLLLLVQKQNQEKGAACDARLRVDGGTD